MAEALGIVTGVIGLLPICANGYFFLEGICKAHKGVEKQMARVQVQRRDLDAWGHVWEIPATLPSRNTEFKLQRWIKSNPSQATNVLDTLADLSDLFADVANLEKHYGFVLKSKAPALQKLSVKTLLSSHKDVDTIRKDVGNRKERMNAVARCHFQLKGTSEFDKLIPILAEFIQGLRNICSTYQADQIDRAISQAVSANTDPKSLATISEVYGEEADRRRNAGQRTYGAELIRDIASFKARVQVLHERRKNLTSQRRQSGNYDAFLLSKGFLDGRNILFPPIIIPSLGTHVRLATDVQACQSRYIEYKGYADTAGKANRIIESDILELYELFKVPNRPQAFRIMDCVGIYREEQQGRFGFVYQPPPYIANIGKRSSIEGRAAVHRVPESLLDMLQRGTEGRGPSSILPLGQRFQLARTLAQSLYVLHATGWVHKNIRSSSVLFLPAESGLTGIPSTSGIKDISNLYLCGFVHSRPADRQQRYDTQGRTTHAQWNINLDEYHHPAKQQDESIPYIQAFDLYSLGAVLLELGLWQPLSRLPNTSTSTSSSFFRHQLMHIAKTELPGQAGQIYADVVVECLRAERSYSDALTQEVLCWKVLGRLDACVA